MGIKVDVVHIVSSSLLGNICQILMPWRGAKQLIGDTYVSVNFMNL